MSGSEVVYPSCGLQMPRQEGASVGGYFHASPECWSVFTELVGAEFSNAFLFGRVHQTTVDTYAVQHAGGMHPDKSIMIHLSGLYLVQQNGLQPTAVPPFLQKLAERVKQWPHLPPPDLVTDITVFDVALASSTEEHIRLVRRWAATVWERWSEYHADIEAFLEQHGILQSVR